MIFLKKGVNIFSIAFCTLLVALMLALEWQVPCVLFDENSVLQVSQTLKKTESCTSVELAAGLECLQTSELALAANDRRNVVIVNSANGIQDTTNRTNVFFVGDSVELNVGEDKTYFIFDRRSRFFELLRRLNTDFSLGYNLEELADTYIPINYFGSTESFMVRYCGYPQSDTIVDRKPHVVLVGYLGKNGDPSMSNDTTEVVYTPRGEMYEAVVLANIIGSFLDRKLIKTQRMPSTVVCCFLILFLNIFVVSKLRNLKRFYLKYKLVQIVEIIVVVGVTFLLIDKFRLLVFSSYYEAIIVAIMEIYIWSVRLFTRIVPSPL